MKIFSIILSLFFVVFFIAGCGRQTANETATEAQTDVENETKTDEPPFFNESTPIGEGALDITAAKNQNGIIVSVDFRVDGGSGDRSGWLYMMTLVESADIAEHVNTVIYTVKDTTSKDVGYATFADGNLQNNQYPAFYDENHDYLNDNTIDKLQFFYDNKAVTAAFNSLRSACGLELKDEGKSSAPEGNESPTEKPVKKEIINNTSANGFYANGNGDYVATGLKVTDYAVLHIEYQGEQYFSVVSYEGDLYDDLLVNTTGSYSGDVLIDHSGDYSLEIKATGDWNITSSGLLIDDTTSFSGSGDAVTGITSTSGGIWEITHRGQSHFSVIEYGLKKGYMDLLANTTGDYSGTVKVESGDNIFFKINADGDWSIKKTD